MSSRVVFGVSIVSIVFDKRVKLNNRPGLHAFVAGVSAYPYLPGGAGKQSARSLGLGQLSSAALSAYEVYKWLLDRKDHLPVPLASIRLLLSPSATELNRQETLRGFADRCTRKNFEREASAWRESANRSDDITFFYFAGHGVHRSTPNDAVLLLDDFGEEVGGILKNTIEIDNLFYGMAPSRSHPNIARTQFYFIDSCRQLPKEFSRYPTLSAPGVWDIEVPTTDDRIAPIFYASIPGERTYAEANDQTVFSKALLTCLNGGAGEVKEENGQGKWYVSVFSLDSALKIMVAELSHQWNFEQRLVLSGLVSDAIIHRLDGPPLVEVTIEIDPLDAVPFTRIEAEDDRGNPISGIPNPLDPHPFTCRWPAGFYRISAVIDPPDSRFVSCPGQMHPILPPCCSLKRVVKNG